MHKRWFGFLILLTVLMGCDRFDVPSFVNTPAPAATPTPFGRTLPLVVPNHSTILQPNTQLAGTQVRFLGKDGNIYRILNNGKDADREVGGSVLWNGLIAPGVLADYRLNVAPSGVNELAVTGRVDLTILDPFPRQADPLTGTGAIVFGDIPVEEIVPVDRPIPGTTITFSGESGGIYSFQQEGQSPTYILGDKLVWRGLLRDNIYIDYQLTIGAVTANGVRISGTSTLTVYPALPPQP